MFVDALLILSGLMAAVHLICAAAILPPRSPISIEVEIAGGFSSAVGLVVTASHADQKRALLFGGALVCFLVLFSIERSLRSKTCIIVFDIFDKKEK